MFLFHIFSHLQKKLNISKIGIVHVNHGLRLKESAKEKMFVSQLAKKYGYSFYYKELQGKNINDTGVEIWARKERYRFFMEIKKKHGYQFIATGHHANDQAETIVMRMNRGSGVAGLRGIQSIRNDGVIRPLLRLKRHEIVSWLKNHGKMWCTDSSNENSKYTRNRIRHEIIPRLLVIEPMAIESIAEIILLVQKMHRFLSSFINNWIRDTVLEDTKNRFVLDKGPLLLKNFMCTEGIAKLFKSHHIPYEKKNILSFLDNINQSHGQFLLKNNWSYYPGKDSIVIVKDASKVYMKEELPIYHLRIPGITYCFQSGFYFIIKSLILKKSELDFDKNNKIIYIDADVMKGMLLFRTIVSTDFFQPLGYTNAIPILEFLKKQKISTYFRHRFRVVAEDSGDIVWVPNIAVSHKFRVTSKTKNIYRISFQRIS